jgi:hypothetical protein
MSSISRKNKSEFLPIAPLGRGSPSVPPRKALKLRNEACECSHSTLDIGAHTCCHGGRSRRRSAASSTAETTPHNGRRNHRTFADNPEHLAPATIETAEDVGALVFDLLFYGERSRRPKLTRLSCAAGGIKRDELIH